MVEIENAPIQTKVQLVHHFKTIDAAGIEAYWLRRFDAQRGDRGEWFSLSSKRVSEFKSRQVHVANSWRTSAMAPKYQIFISSTYEDLRDEATKYLRPCSRWDISQLVWRCSVLRTSSNGTSLPDTSMNPTLLRGHRLAPLWIDHARRSQLYPQGI